MPYFEIKQENRYPYLPTIEHRGSALLAPIWFFDVSARDKEDANAVPTNAKQLRLIKTLVHHANNSIETKSVLQEVLEWWKDPNKSDIHFPLKRIEQILKSEL